MTGAAYRKPFLKWAGNKFRLLDRILPYLAGCRRLVEPFAGSGAVFLNAGAEEAAVCDRNADLIGLYRHLQEEGEDFIRYCRSFFTGDSNTKEAYAALRGRYNSEDDSRVRAALLLYVNRHGYNGLIRYNAKGGYNVPFGRYAAPYFPETEMRQFVDKTRAVKTAFRACDFREAFSLLRPGDAVYCDPPYAPLTATANFSGYAGKNFGVGDHEDLARLAGEAARRGIPVLVSNHDTAVTRSLYSGAAVASFAVQRSISCVGGKRGKAPEIVAFFRARRPESGWRQRL